MPDLEERELEFRLLGPLEARIGGRQVEIRSGKQRALLALLLLRLGHPVSRDRVIDTLWGERPPPTAQKMVHVFISRLRRLLGDEAIVTSTAGYTLCAPARSLDLALFDELVSDAREELGREPAVAEARLREALGLWRGPALADIDEPAFVGDRARLDESRAALLEQIADAALAAGAHERLVGDLELWVIEHPLRERLRGQLMLALYRSHRQAEALAAYTAARSTLVEELGIEPSRSLQELQARILSQDRTLDEVSDVAQVAPFHEPAPSSQVRRKPLVVVGLAAAAAAAAALAAALVATGNGGEATAAARSLATIDARTGRVTGDTTLSAQPGRLVASHGRAWVGLASDAVQEFDESGSLRATYGVPAVPSDLAAGGGSVWVANGYTGTLSRIVARPAYVSSAFRPDPAVRGRVLVAATARDLWTALQDGRILVLDPRTLRVERTLRGGRFPTSLTVSGRYLWETLPATGDLVRIDIRSGDRAVLQVGAVAAAASGYETIWAAGADRVWRVNSHSLSIEATLPAPGATDLAVAANAVWVVSSADGLLYEIDVRTNELVRTKSLDHPIGGIAVAGPRLLLTLR